jgi:hypothetical protein
MDSPVTQVLRDLDALIVVSSPWMDGGGRLRAAVMTGWRIYARMCR